MSSKSRPKNKAPKILRKRRPDTSLEGPEEEEHARTSLMTRKGQAIHLLSGTRMPTQFRFRERQTERIAEFLQLCVRDEKKGVRFLMLTGSPGAGKSLTVHSLLARHGCKIIKMNANVVRSLQDVQLLIGSELLQEKGEISCTAPKLVSMLQEAQYNQVCVVYIEEIELLFKADPTPITEDFMKLFQKKGLRLILIGISNTIDTLLKSSSKFCFKMQDIENVIFSPYTAEQLGEIMKDKLAEVQRVTDIEIAFTDRLIRYASLKLETLKKGDFRVCLEFLKGVAQKLLDRPEANQQMDREKQVKEEQTRQRIPAHRYVAQIGDINQVLGKMNISKQVVINGLPHQQKVMLIAIYLFIRKTDALCLTPLELQPEVRWICDSLQLNYTKQLMNDGLAELEQYGLVELKNKPDGQKIMLKIPLDQVENAFQDHFIFKKFFQ